MTTETSRRRWRPTLFLGSNVAINLAAIGGALVVPQTWGLAAGAVLASHVAMASAGMWPRSTLLGPNLVRLPPRERGVALTFDDGPDPRTTPRVLDLLAEKNARATFFCVGRRAERHPDLIARIVEEGHRVENHSHHHSNAFAFLGPRALGRELDRAQETLTELTGRRPRYFRAPAGMRGPWLEPVLARRGLHLAAWTRRGFDAVDPNADRIAHRLLQGLQEGDILLQHDGSMASDQDRTATVVDVLRRILAAIAHAGLTTAPLPAPRSPE